VRVDIDTFEVENPKEAMKNFKSALAQVVNVPKSVIDRNRKRAKAKSKKKPKS
jgi:hypothetical protein